MQVIRYVNGRKVQDVPGQPAVNPTVVVIPPAQRVITKITSAPPQPNPVPASTGGKGCGCGK